MLLNKSELADKLNVHRSFVTAMCAWGFKLALGNRTTLDDAMTWLRENPTFPGINRQPKTKPHAHRKTRPRVKQAVHSPKQSLCEG